MTRKAQRAAVAAIAILGAACSELPSSNRSNVLGDVAAAFTTVPLGYSDVTSSYAGDGGAGPALFLPGGQGPGFGRGPGGHGGPGIGEMMGGGVDDAFVGGVERGRGFGHHGPFGGPLARGGAFTCTGTFSSANNRFVCDPLTHDGVTITRSAAYTDASGAVQQAFDTVTTNTVNVQTQATGTVTFDATAAGDQRRGPGHHPHIGRITGDTTTIISATTTVSHTSDRTVGGLAQGSTQRTVSGTSRGTESSTGESSRGSFTATRTAADTTTGVIVPLQDGRPTYPTAGRVVRVMTATVTYAGQAAVTSTRREVVTYDGTPNAQVTITKDGTTQSCTLPLPRGRLSCS